MEYSSTYTAQQRYLPKAKKPCINARLFCVSKIVDYLFTLAERSAPALNFATFLAAILMAFPV